MGVSSVSLLEVAASGASLVDIWGRSIGVFVRLPQAESAGLHRRALPWAADSVVACRVSRVARRQQACARCFVGDATDWQLERPTLVL